MAADLDARWPADPLTTRVSTRPRRGPRRHLPRPARRVRSLADRLLARIASAEPTPPRARFAARGANVDRQAVSAARHGRRRSRRASGPHRGRRRPLHRRRRRPQRACLSCASRWPSPRPWYAGRYDAAARERREALAAAERLGAAQRSSAYVKHTLGYAAARPRRLRTRRVAAETSRPSPPSAAIGDHRLSCGARGYLAAILAMAGDLEAGEREATEALDGRWTRCPRSAPGPRPRAPTSAGSAAATRPGAVARRGGRVRRARRSGRHRGRRGLVRLAYGEALRRGGASRRRLRRRSARRGGACWSERRRSEMRRRARGSSRRCRRTRARWRWPRRGAARGEGRAGLSRCEYARTDDEQRCSETRFHSRCPRVRAGAPMCVAGWLMSS